MVLQPVAGRAALWLAAQAGCTHGKVLLRPGCPDGGQPHAANHCHRKSDQGPIFAASDDDCCPAAGSVQLKRASLGWAALVSSSGWVRHRLPWSCVSLSCFGSCGESARL